MFNLTKVLTKLLKENLIFAQRRMTKKEFSEFSIKYTTTNYDLITQFWKNVLLLSSQEATSTLAYPSQ